MADRIPEIPAFWLIAGLSVGTIVVGIGILLLSWFRLARQKRAQRQAVDGHWQAVAALKPPSRLPEIIAAVLPLAVAAASVRAIQGSRNLLLTAMDLGDSGEKARFAAQALNGELNGVAMGLWVMPLTVLVGGVAVAFAVSARLRARGLRRAASLAARADDASGWLKFPGPNTGALVAGIVAFLALGFAPIARSGFAAIATMISHFAATTGLEPEQKGAILNEGLDRSSQFLDQGFLVARGGVLIAALIALYLAWQFSPARARAAVPGGARPVPDQGMFGPLVALGVIAAAAAGFLAARPMRAENQLPWPPFAGGERLLWKGGTPDVEGPDDLRPAPVIHVTPEALGLDGREASPTEIAKQLMMLRRNHGLFHPNESFDGEVHVICQSDTPNARLSLVLRAALDGRHPHATFGFLRRDEIDRPLLGHRWRNLPSAARTTVVATRADADPGAVVIEVERFRTCTDLSKEIVAARRAQHEVALLLPASRR
ncbi:MAG TPA: hypothetical protein VN903_04750 [Polyangia bacterium]|nr:hypothetical protein [Polyangia bacterium]